MQKIRLGGMELKALFALEEDEATVITLSELAGKLKLTRIQAWKLASRLVRKKRLIRLKRGVYLFAPMKSGPRGLWTENALAMVPQLMNGDYYVGFWAALNYYGLTEQIPFSVQIVTTSRQRNFEALQTRFEFIQVRHLGEWREEKISKRVIKFATMEQLILDCLALPEKSGGVKEACQALWNARNRLDWKKLEELAFKSSDAVRRRLGYICGLLGVRKLKPKKIAGWRWLDPSAPKKAMAKSERWGLLLNVSKKELTEWREY
ncbi:MAG: type IV toxin-antitoxin system AbiEi family antitoxin [Candidatus ainarchaeum sp.]|nr:type IV toxin-antitoxin system AbiEi family antitoxin [Candidatus ainarchaeum sp.]